MKKLSRIGLCITAAMLLGLPSFASARLENSQPDAHEQANVTSFNMVLAFSQRVRLKETIVEIRNSRGARVTIGDLRTGENGTDLEIPLSTPLRPDTYSIRWRAVSIQGLVDVGGYDFVIDPMPTGVPGVAQQ
ncbi:copper resistance protein CopC [Rhizobium sp. L51/94]|uniref:copper resistance protein CopC n=1 Tax=Rhizobium sp. L51/94 TaxID=2819999 RepID=UPI001C5AE695|nr:copper resistance protein CopC [Rhizobium sp. L51/94]QXZ80772.1 copper resistance protein CopC [Rhizobium sp. L51/94]